jgi:hypothetical protein
MAAKNTSVSNSTSESQSGDIVSTQKMNNAVAAVRMRRKQTKRSVGSMRTLGILAIDLAIVADNECFHRRYEQTTGENSGRLFVCALYI